MCSLYETDLGEYVPTKSKVLCYVFEFRVERVGVVFVHKFHTKLPHIRCGTSAIVDNQFLFALVILLAL